MLRLGLAGVVVLFGAVACGIAERTVLENSAGSTGTGGSAGTTAGSGSAQAGRGGGKMMGEPAVGGAGVYEPSCGDGANPTPLQPLSSWEYRRSVEALTGAAVSEVLPPDPVSVSPFAWAMSLQASTVERLFAEAEKQGAAARGGTLLPCPAAGPASAECATGFVDAVLGRAFRRPPSPEERERYLGLFKIASSLDTQTGVEVVVTAALLSPHFLYEAYWGDGGSELTSFEVASKLSYLLTGSPPDASLLEAAAAGSLLTDEGVAEQARRLLDGPVHMDAVQHFHAQWLGLDQLAELQTPGLTPELLAAMRTDTEWFVKHAFDSRALPNLFKSSAAYVDHELGAYYDVPAAELPEAGAGFVQVSLAPTRYFGLLTHGSTLSLFNNPSRRGKFVRERLLCQSVPPPPPGVVTDIEISPNQTRRQAWEQHRQDPACAGCHSLIDPIGFGFEHFDELGRYQVTDNGLPIDASGELQNAGDADGPFADVNELAQSLWESEAVARCYASTWLSYAQQRPLTEGDSCAVDTIYDAFASTDFDLVELFLAIARSSQFRSREPVMLGAPPPGAGPSGSVASLAARRKLLLDFTMSELQSLQQVVSLDDRRVLDEHLSSVRELEQKLSQL